MHLPEIIRRTGFRWGVAVAAILAFGTTLMFGLVYWLGTHALFSTVDKSVLEQLELLSARPPALLPFMITSRLRDMREEPHVITLVGLFDQGGKPLVGSIRRIPDQLQLNGQVQMILSSAPPDYELQHERVAGRRLPDNRILVVARDVEDLLAMRSGVLRALAVTLIPAILLSVAGGIFVGARTQRRLIDLRHTAERIIAGHLEERLATRLPGDELDQLSTMVNRILDRFEELVHALKGIGEDIAHDLRTPLTSVRARLERARERGPDQPELIPAIDRSIAGIDQALAIVTALLRIAEVENGRRYAGFSEFDLAEVVRDTGDTYQPVAEEKRIDLVVDAPAPARILGDRDLLVEALVNLLDNAIKFTPPEGRVCLALSCVHGRPLLRVADSGVGIPESDRELVFQRFYRSDRSRGSKGTGLGLSLVAAVAKLHGFELSLSDNNPGCVVEMHCGPSFFPATLGPA